MTTPTTTILPPETYGPQTVTSGETLLSQHAQSTTIIQDTGGFYTFGVNDVVSTTTGAQIGDLLGDGFTIDATNPGGVAVQLVGSNEILEGNILSANDSVGMGGGDLVTGSGANNLTIEGNTFEGTGNWLAYVNGALDTYTASTNVNFINNTFTGTATAGADISDDAASGTISGNTFSGSGSEAIFLGTISAAVANAFNAAYGTTYVPVPGTITVTGNNFSGWVGADVSTYDASYTFAHGGAGVTFTDTVTGSGQEIDKVTGWTGGTISLDTGFDTALYALQNGKNEVDVFLSTGDEIIVQGSNVNASTIGAMLDAPAYQASIEIGSYTIGFVGNDNDLISIGSYDLVAIGNGNDSISIGNYDIVAIGNGNDQISIGSHDVVVIGNGTDLITSGTGGNISDDIITIGTGANDFLHAANNIDNSLIIFGNGADDHMTADNGISNDTIIFGNGVADSVITAVPPGDGGSISDSTIALGNGAGDFVGANVDLSGDTITLGKGAGDHVDAFASINSSTITFGDVAGNTGDNVLALGSISGSEIAFGNGAGDNVVALASISGDTITFGNGSNDSVTGGDGGSDKITLGNGSSDAVSLTGPSPGGDYVATGTGASDMVTVGSHTNPDTFVFGLGTNGTNYTTVNGAAAGDAVEVLGGQLGNTLVKESTTDTTLASFISSLGHLTKGDTYVGSNASDTFVVTETASGQTGAVELTEAFHNSVLANHILHLA
jgi:fibronectin-binding autotransporter adhesin